ncbi:hypothetical protein OEZ85_002572 [Tetradesmus obliquus]|uniref:DUF11 domain-containing protein n=1 Tax=Tetradesmus obliquus TaxID=3088 RepID=A0ABY8U0J1_TETOB|nr:hypothetical protein OEZ85_002572 [Tetradesmus obliquus]
MFTASASSGCLLPHKRPVHSQCESGQLLSPSPSPSPAPPATADVEIRASLSASQTLIADLVVLTAIVSNPGPVAAGGVLATINVPVGLIVTQAGVPAGCTLSGSATAGQVLTCNIGLMAGGTSQTFVMPVASNAPGNFTINSSVTAANDNNPANNGPVPAVLQVTRTCGQYFADKSRFDCGSQFFNTSAAANPNPSQLVCCRSTNINPNSAVDVSVAITGPASVIVGSVFDLTLTAKLESLNEAANVTVTATLPAGLQLVSTPAGCTAANGKITCVVSTLTGSRPFTVVLPVTALQSGSQTTTAVVNTTSPDTQPANNAAQQTLVALASCCNAQGSCSHVASAADCGSSSTFTANQNCTTSGCRAAVDPVGACCATSGCLGTNFTLQTCSAVQGTFKIGVQTCSAAGCAVAEQPDVAVSTGVSQRNVLISGGFTYTMTVTNVGRGGASGVKVVGTLPAGLTYGNVPGCTISGQTITCDVSSLAPGASVDFSVPVKATAPGLHNFTASVTADGDSNPSNDGPSPQRVRVRQTCAVFTSDGGQFPCGPLLRYNASAGSNPNPSAKVCCTSRPIDPESGAEVSLTATLTRRVKVGDVSDLLLTVTAVEQANSNVMLTFTLPPGLEMVQVPAGCSISGRRRRQAAGSNVTYVCRIRAMNAGESRSFNAKVKAVTTGSHTVPAVVTADRDSITTNNLASPTVLVLGACCNPRIGACSDTTAALCRGNFSTTLSCAASSCKATPAQQGSCCAAGVCTRNVPKSGCSGIWRADNSCSFCQALSPLGACCSSTCSQTSEAACRSATAGMAKWTQGAQCGDVCKPAPAPRPSPTPPAPGVCVQQWDSCNFPKPGQSDPCCGDNTCQLASTNGLWNLQYACKPKPRSGCPNTNSAAVRAAAAGTTSALCGRCTGGGVCCPGLICKWDTITNRGFCKDPAAVLPDGSMCSSDLDCQPGSRCASNTCRKAESCARKCNNAACKQERLKDCAYLTGNAAARLGMVLNPPSRGNGKR